MIVSYGQVLGDDMTECYIWDTPATMPTDSDGDYVYLDSPRAGGKYRMTGTAASTISNLNETQKARLTTWLCRQRRAGIEYPYRHLTELIFCDQLTQVGVLSERFGTFPAIRSATNRDKAGPMIRTSIKRATCCAITNPTSTLVDAAIMATESAPPGLVAR
jgi:hypothetical protein